MKWYRSLYVRIAVGFVICLAAILLVQAMLFVWVASRSGPRVPGQPPDRFAEAVANEIGLALADTPSLDLDQHVREQYGRHTHQIIVVMADGRLITNGGAVPDPTVRQMQGMLEAWRRDGFRPFGRSGRTFGSPGPPDGFAGPERPPGVPGAPGPGGPRREGPGGRGGFRGERPWPIVVDGGVTGLVFVPPLPPFGFVLARYAQTLAIVAGGALVIGALLVTAIVFGPARRRLQSVEDAARRFGAGDLTARAPEAGGDEVAAVASAFNTMAEDLEARADALAESDRVRRRLLADVSHELATPVTAMRGYLETLTMPEMAVDEATRNRYLSILGDETARLERLIGDLLDLARLEGGGTSFAMGEVAIAPLLARVSATHERACLDRGVTLRTHVDPGADVLRGDGARLEQALQNLTANAARYAPPGSTVELRAAPSETGMVMSVSDEGPGIAAEHLPHVFDRFYKAEPSRAQGSQGTMAGSGLGLSIAKAIVERHGGTIAVNSQPGRTVFSIVIPR
jgi:signal transduction histidine kinase